MTLTNERYSTHTHSLISSIHQYNRKKCNFSLHKKKSFNLVDTLKQIKQNYIHSMNNEIIEKTKIYIQEQGHHLIENHTTILTAIIIKKHTHMHTPHCYSGSSSSCNDAALMWFNDKLNFNCKFFFQLNFKCHCFVLPLCRYCCCFCCCCCCYTYVYV
ncbi:hypothetical protein DERF_014996 [Dermatophagoides farinae]|uniref:Uncharacterized protein n=1 Tax=Dermatophagoides farinae TaxID=6954 RepID=A0A922HQC8_DERFA|nr:hypothetical protein DERF_014996 [Dermatophagoides farinae]